MHWRDDEEGIREEATHNTCKAPVAGGSMVELWKWKGGVDGGEIAIGQ